MTVNISENTFYNDVKDAVVARNYKDLFGTDVEGIIEKDMPV